MEQSEHDPGAKGKPAWNAGRKLGAERALAPRQVFAIRFWPDSEKHMHDRAVLDLTIDKQTGSLRAVQILLGHTKIESTVRYLGVDVETP